MLIKGNAMIKLVLINITLINNILNSWIIPVNLLILWWYYVFDLQKVSFKDKFYDKFLSSPYIVYQFNKNKCQKYDNKCTNS